MEKLLSSRKTVDDALKQCPSVETVIVVRRTENTVKMEPGRDYWYHELIKLPIANGKSPTEVMDSEDPLYILYLFTSGTTGKPKAHSSHARRIYGRSVLNVKNVLICRIRIAGGVPPIRDGLRDIHKIPSVHVIFPRLNVVHE